MNTQFVPDEKKTQSFVAAAEQREEMRRRA
jgi:hypothetical protein